MSARCDSCTSPAVTRISITMAEGSVVDFTSCHRCEHRTWEHAGEELSVDAVLDHSRKG